MRQRSGFHVPREAAAALTRIRGRSRDKSEADAVRLGIHVYDDLLQLSRNNRTLIIVDLEGRETLFSPHLRFASPWRAAANATTGSEAESTRQRTGVFFTDGTPALIETIRQSLLMTSAGDVIRNAVLVLDELTAAAAIGSKLVVRGEAADVCYDPFAPLHLRQGDKTLSAPRPSAGHGERGLTRVAHGS